MTHFLFVHADTDLELVQEFNNVKQCPWLGGRQPSTIAVATVSTLITAAVQLPAPSGTLSRITSGTRPSVQSVSDVCLKRICLLDTSAFSVLEVLNDYCAI